MKTTKERPILFCTEMVRAILREKDPKTQTRRVAGLRAREWPLIPRHCPYGVPGDRLWVRETFAPRHFDNGKPAYRADWDGTAADIASEPRWKPSIFMRRQDARIVLEVTEVRVERLQDISEGDARAEGFEHVEAFERQWDHINGKREPRSWSANPWVWCVSFKRLLPVSIAAGDRERADAGPARDDRPMHESAPRWFCVLSLSDVGRGAS